MKNKKLYNYLPNLIISLFLAFIFLALSLLFAADNIFFEPTTYTNSMHKIKIEDTAFQEIQTYCEQQYAYTGVEADTLKKSINKTDVSNAIYSYVEDTFNYILGKKSELPEFKADFTLLEKNISDDYTKWAEKEGVKYTQELEDIKQKTIKNVEQAIESDLDVMLLSHINKPNGISTKLKDLLVLARKIRIALIATAVIFIGVMAAVNRKHIGGLLYWVGTSLFCSSMLILVPCAILKGTKYYDGLAIHNDTVYNALTRSMYGLTDSLIKLSTVTLVVAVLFMALFALIINLTKFKKKEKC